MSPRRWAVLTAYLLVLVLAVFLASMGAAAWSVVFLVTAATFSALMCWGARC